MLQPRRRRDPSPRNIHVAAAAATRLVSAAATRLRNIHVAAAAATRLRLRGLSTYDFDAVARERRRVRAAELDGVVAALGAEFF